MIKVNTNTDNVINFSFDTKQVRVVLINDEPWFVAKDIVEALGYSVSTSPARITSHIPAQWKGVNPIHTLGGQQSLLMLSEQGLYFFICRSDKNAALSFQVWLAGEVLPSIRKNGHYGDTTGKLDALISQTIGVDGFSCLSSIIEGKIRNIPAVNKNKIRMGLWKQLHRAFNVAKAELIPADKLDAARNFIAAYVLEGEYIASEVKSGGNMLTDLQLYDVFFLCRRVECLYDVFKKYKLHQSLFNLGSRAGAEMIDHFKSGHSAVQRLQKLAPEFESVQQRLQVNQYYVEPAEAQAGVLA